MFHTSLKIHTVRELRLLPPAVGQPWSRSKNKVKGPIAKKNPVKVNLALAIITTQTERVGLRVNKKHSRKRKHFSSP